MNIKGIIWVGSATENQEESTRFFSEVMGMPVVTNVSGFTRLAAENGDRLEFFGPDSVEHDHLDTGPVAGLWVEDCAEARSELISAGVDGVTELEVGPDGHHWFYFRAPNGDYYEMCEHPTPRPPRASEGRAG
jgi:catechol 2,3-dioxygenase-like lactoylglutathione lyase family enzyme